MYGIVKLMNRSRNDMLMTQDAVTHHHKMLCWLLHYRYRIWDV